MGDSTKRAESPAVELRDLQSVLREGLANEVTVVSFTTEPLLPLGENYNSTIMKVSAVVRRKDDGKEERLDLVAKMMPPSQVQRDMFDSPTTFRKEAFLYEKLIPAYKQLQRELGLDEDLIFDIVPDFYGARFSLDPSKEIDDNAVILMQNLKSYGYYMENRKLGLDLSHAKIATVALSRFHALGIATKKHKPETFEIFKVRAKCLNFGSFDKDFTDYIDFMIKTFEQDPEMSAHWERIKTAMTEDPDVLWRAVPSEPWSTIIHSDFWINNFMFRDDPITYQVSQIKFVDFQNFLFSSPLRELVFFVMMNLDQDVMQNKFDWLIDYYYENFIRELESLKCDVEEFTRDDFDQRLKVDAFKEFSHCAFMSKVMTKAVPDQLEAYNMEHLIEKEMYPELLQKLRGIVKKYADKGWFDE